MGFYFLKHPKNEKWGSKGKEKTMCQAHLGYYGNTERVPESGFVEGKRVEISGGGDAWAKS